MSGKTRRTSRKWRGLSDALLIVTLTVLAAASLAAAAFAAQDHPARKKETVENSFVSGPIKVGGYGGSEVVIGAATFVGQDRDYPVQRKGVVEKTLRFADPGKPGEIVVDNVFGPIKVEGTSGSEVVLVARKTIFAKDEARVKRAEEEVTLDIQEKGNTIDVYVDGPFRERNREARGVRSWRDPGYEVHYDFAIKVPVRTNVAVSTVLAGDVEVRNVEGEFDVHNVNGKVRVSDVSGSGTAKTVNGEVTVAFKRSPNGECSLKTVNGDAVITLPEGTSADFRVKTFNGDVYSDFSVTALPAKPAVREDKDGKYVYKSDRFFGVRTGKGGPEILMDTMNGDILIKKKSA
jgi:hypothetical protein